MSSTLLAPLERLYAAGVRLKYARPRSIGYEQLEWPVISVGNLSIGGSGKTPFSIYLVRLLTERGWSVDVLSRGYHRRSDGPDFTDPEQVRPEGSAARYGDEPLMIARATGAPVYVGASRYAAGKLAEEGARASARRVHLLDDGFQHRRLARTVDIVLLHRSDLAGRLLPRGRLREPLSALARADVVVLPAGDEDLAGPVGRFLRPGGSLWRVQREFTIPENPGRSFAFSAIARPEDFHHSLRQTGVEVVAARSFRDHHRYRLKDIAEIARKAKSAGCRCFFTTEKDAVKLDSAMRAELARTAPLFVARLSMRLEDEGQALGELLSWLESATGAP